MMSYFIIINQFYQALIFQLYIIIYLLRKIAVMVTHGLFICWICKNKNLNLKELLLMMVVDYAQGTIGMLEYSLRY